MKDRIELKSLPLINLSMEQLEVMKYTYKWVKDLHQKTEERLGIQVGGYQIGHSERVASMALVLACYEEQNPYLHFIGGMLHDLGRAQTDDPRSKNYLHGQLSRELAQPIFEDISLTGEMREIIENAIEDHPLLNERVRDTVYVRILQDADRLDGLSGYEPMRLGQGSWRLPVVGPVIGNSTKENEITTARQILSRIIEWEDMLWTKTARSIASQATPLLKKLAQESDIRSNFIYGVYQKLNITV